MSFDQFWVPGKALHSGPTRLEFSVLSSGFLARHFTLDPPALNLVWFLDSWPGTHSGDSWFLEVKDLKDPPACNLTNHQNDPRFLEFKDLKDPPAFVKYLLHVFTSFTFFTCYKNPLNSWKIRFGVKGPERCARSGFFPPSGANLRSSGSENVFWR